MNKRYWKDRARTAETQVGTLLGEIRELRREIEDKRKNWAPIKIVHPYTPGDPSCMLCDDPPEDPRHAAGRLTVTP